MSVSESVTDSEIPIRRETPRFDGLYLEGTVQDQEVNMTIDTGATSSLLSTQVYFKIPEECRPQLRKRGGFSTADGRSMEYLGEGNFQLDIGELKFDLPLSVTKIDDDLLLGTDVLRDDPSGPCDILLSESKMMFRGTNLPIKCLSRRHKTRRVKAADRYVIPGLSQVIIDALIERSPNSCDEEKNLIVEPLPDLGEKVSLLMGRCLVDVSDKCTVAVRILNPHKEDLPIEQDTVLGYAEPTIEKCTRVLDQEFYSDIESQSAVVRQISDSLADGSSKIPSHLTEMYQEASLNKTVDEKAQIAALVQQHANVFSKTESDLGLTTLTEHEIDTGDAKPIKQPPRRVPLAFIGEDKAAIEKLCKQGSIRPSNSPWASPIVLVRKRDGSVRPCVDYRRLNAVTKRDAFPLPRCQDCLDAVANSTLFSTLDVTSAYNQIPVKKEDIPKTAFVSKYGLFEYTTMPFGLTNSPATFQRTMELALSQLQWTSCLIYLDDVVVFGRTFDEHVRRLNEVLSRIHAAGLKLKPSKCHLLKEKVVFLGHVVSKEGVLPNPENIDKVVNWPVPRNVSDVRAILGLGSYYRRFVPNYSRLVHPLTQLTQKKIKFVWTRDCQAAFDELKRTLVSAKIMAYPRDEGEYILDTDACGTSIGCVLSQVQDGVERVIAYSSKTLAKAERNYCVTERELLAVKYFIAYHKTYLLGRKFTVRTDHQALKWLYSLKEPKDRIARWIETLSAFDFVVEYRPGKKHGNADAMSRCPIAEGCQCPEACDELTLKCGPCRKCRNRLENSEETKSADDPGARSSAEPIRVCHSEEHKTTLSVIHVVYFMLCVLVYSKLMFSHVGAHVGEKQVVVNLPDVFKWSLHIVDVFQFVAFMMVVMDWISAMRGGRLDVSDVLASLERAMHQLAAGSVELTKDVGSSAGGSLQTLFWFTVGAVNRVAIMCGDRCDVSQVLASLERAIRWLIVKSVGLTKSVLTSRARRTRSAALRETQSVVNLQREQSKDEHIAPVLKWMRAGIRPSSRDVATASPATRHYWLLWDSLKLQDDVLYRNFHKKDGTGNYLQLIVPKSIRDEVLFQMHNSILSGHLGRKKTQEKTLQRYYWYQVREDVNTWLAKCDVCGAIKIPRSHAKAPLGQMGVGAPLDRLATDILGPLPETPRGNKYILVVTDYFTKWVEIFPIPDQTASTCATVIINEVIARFGCPYDMHSDQGRNYESELFAECCRLLEIRKTRTSPMNPRCNGQTENFNKTLVKMIKSYLKGEQSTWDIHLGCLAGAYRATPNASTGITPNLMMLGREVRLPSEIIFGSPVRDDQNASTYGDYVHKLKSRFQWAHKVAREHLKVAAKRQKQNYDAKLTFHSYKAGDYVWYKTGMGQLHLTPKLRSSFAGPFLVVKKINDLIYLIQLNREGKRKVVHHNNLKPYLGTTKLRWAKTSLAKSRRVNVDC